MSAAALHDAQHLKINLPAMAERFSCVARFRVLYGRNKQGVTIQAAMWDALLVSMKERRFVLRLAGLPAEYAERLAGDIPPAELARILVAFFKLRDWTKLTSAALAALAAELEHGR